MSRLPDGTHLVGIPPVPCRCIHCRAIRAVDIVSGNAYSKIHGEIESGTAPSTAPEARETGPEAIRHLPASK